MSVFNPELREHRESGYENNILSPELEARLLKALDDGMEVYADIVQCPNRSCGNPLKIEIKQDHIRVNCLACGWETILRRNDNGNGE